MYIGKRECNQTMWQFRYLPQTKPLHPSLLHQPKKSFVPNLSMVTYLHHPQISHPFPSSQHLLSSTLGQTCQGKNLVRLYWACSGGCFLWRHTPSRDTDTRWRNNTGENPLKCGARKSYCISCLERDHSIDTAYSANVNII